MLDERVRLAMSGAPLQEQRAALDGALQAAGISNQTRQVLTDSVEDGVLLVEAAGGTSRVGGARDVQLPTGMAWPESSEGPLPFIYEIDLHGVVQVDRLPILPSEGRLLVFIDQWVEFEPASACLVWVGPDTSTEPAAPASWDGQPIGSRRLQGAAIPLLSLNPAVYEDLAALGDQPIYSLVGKLKSAVPYMEFHHTMLGPPPQREHALPGIIKWWFEEVDEGRDQYSDAELAGAGWTYLMSPGDAKYPGENLELDWSTAGGYLVLVPTVDLETRRFERAICIPA